MNTRKYSSSQEKKVAKKVGGKQVANSGATAFHKGDVRTNQFLIECKTSTKEVKSVRIQKDWLDKIDEEAFAMNKPYSALAFDFGGYESEQYFIINESLFRQLQTYLEGQL